MRVLVQRVLSSEVCISNNVVAKINRGFLLFVGIEGNDSTWDLEWMVNKVLNLRIFEDKAGKMNLNIKQVQGEILSVSQFTLCADMKKGNRPGFDNAAKPDKAKKFWLTFNQKMRDLGGSVAEGVFGAHMQISLINDGPVTIGLDSKA